MERISNAVCKTGNRDSLFLRKKKKILKMFKASVIHFGHTHDDIHSAFEQGYAGLRTFTQPMDEKDHQNFLNRNFAPKSKQSVRSVWSLVSFCIKSHWTNYYNS
jgi:hypothetical protein